MKKKFQTFFQLGNGSAVENKNAFNLFPILVSVPVGPIDTGNKYNNGVRSL